MHSQVLQASRAGPPASRRRTRAALAALIVAGLLAGCAAQRMNSDGKDLLRNGQTEAGLEKLRGATEADPGNAQYRIDLVRARDGYGRKILAQAQRAREDGHFEEARELYLKLLAVHRENEQARRGLIELDGDVRQTRMLEEATQLRAANRLNDAREKVRAVLQENPGNARAQVLITGIEEQVQRAQNERDRVLAAQSSLKRPVTLQFRDANLKLVFEALSRTSGLNIILDRDVKPDLKTTIYVKDASVEDTVDLILLQNQLEKRVLNNNTLFVYPATQAKQKEYQELKVRTWQLSNVEAKQMQSVLKSILKVKDLVVDDRTNTLVLRDTPETIAVAEKIIAAQDLADPEVMLEVEVLEVSSSRVENLGISWPGSFGVSTPTSVNTWGALRALKRDDLSITALSIGAQFNLSDSDARVLASPRIRARNNEKAKILIGDKVPIFTNALTPLSTGGSVVTGTVQYIDIGLKLDVEPHIYAEGEVGIKINLEVSNITGTLKNDQSGTSAPQIGTRNATTSLRLKDGETQVLAGLIRDEERNSANKVPGLGQAPVVGRLFSSNSDNTNKTEVVLAITPRIIRAQGHADARTRDVWSGTDGQVRENPLRLDPIGAVGTSPTAAQPALQTPPAPAPTSGVVSPAPAPVAIPPTSPEGVEPPASSAAPEPAASIAPAVVSAAAAGITGGAAGLAGTAAASRTVASAAAAGTAAGTAAEVATKAPAGTAGATAAPRPAAAAGAAAGTAAVAGTAAAAGTATPVTLAANSAEFTLEGPGEVIMGQPFEVTLRARTAGPLRLIPVQFRFDAQAFSVEDVTPGSLAANAGIESVQPAIDTRVGRVDVTLTTQGDSRIHGDGTLLTLKLMGRSPRITTRVAVAAIRLTGDEPLTVSQPAQLVLRVKGS
jgi:general secretion pathway protein D